MTRLRRMSTILSTYEMSTGHCSSQARQRRARPENVRVDDVRHEVHRLERGDVSFLALSGERFLFAPVEVVAKGEREMLRAEDLPRAVRGAVVRAARHTRCTCRSRGSPSTRSARCARRRSAAAARVRRSSAAAPTCLHQLLGVLRHRLEPPGGLEAAREDVRDRRDDVEVLRVRQKVEEEKDERRRASRSRRARRR